MFRPFISLITIVAFLMASCGLQKDNMTTMTEEEAIKTLAMVPMTATENDDSETTSPTVDGLVSLLEERIEAGDVVVNQGGKRSALNLNSVDLSSLLELFSLIQNGSTSIRGLASGLLQSNGGDVTKTKFNINMLVQIINSLMPVILAIAPQYAAILQGILVILPLIQTIIGLFRKPKKVAHFVPILHLA